MRPVQNLYSNMIKHIMATTFLWLAIVAAFPLYAQQPKEHTWHLGIEQGGPSMGIRANCDGAYRGCGGLPSVLGVLSWTGWDVGVEKFLKSSGLGLVRLTGEQPNRLLKV